MRKQYVQFSDGRKLNFYEFFEINPDASQEALKAAYRKMCFKYHPDKNPETREKAERTFKVIQEIWSILSNPSSREEYDFVLGLKKTRMVDEVWVYINGNSVSTGSTVSWSFT